MARTPALPGCLSSPQRARRGCLAFPAPRARKRARPGALGGRVGSATHSFPTRAISICRWPVRLSLARARAGAAKPRRPWPAQLAPILSWNSRRMETPRPRDKERLRVVRIPPASLPIANAAICISFSPLLCSALLWMTMRCTAHAMLSCLAEEKEGKGAPTPTPTRVNYCAESCYRARHVLATRYLPTYRTVA